MKDLILPNFNLEPIKGITSEFLRRGFTDFYQAVHYIWQLPYGRNSDRADFRQVLKEKRGTCSTKHALLAELASEQGQSVHLMLGIFGMNRENTPEIAEILCQFNMDYMPEAHCYLRYFDKQLDFTKKEDAGSLKAKIFFYEERIKPDQIGEYKETLHKKFLRYWITESGFNKELNFEQVWNIRESCIAKLSGKLRS